MELLISVASLLGPATPFWSLMAECALRRDPRAGASDLDPRGWGSAGQHTLELIIMIHHDLPKDRVLITLLRQAVCVEAWGTV